MLSSIKIISYAYCTSHCKFLVHSYSLGRWIILINFSTQIKYCCVRRYYKIIFIFISQLFLYWATTHQKETQYLTERFPFNDPARKSSIIHALGKKGNEDNSNEEG